MLNTCRHAKSGRATLVFPAHEDFGPRRPFLSGRRRVPLSCRGCLGPGGACSGGRGGGGRPRSRPDNSDAGATRADNVGGGASRPRRWPAAGPGGRHGPGGAGRNLAAPLAGGTATRRCPGRKPGGSTTAAKRYGTQKNKAACITEHTLGVRGSESLALVLGNASSGSDPSPPKRIGGRAREAT